VWTDETPTVILRQPIHRLAQTLVAWLFMIAG